jgi:hypothetical protein
MLIEPKKVNSVLLTAIRIGIILKNNRESADRSNYTADSTALILHGVCDVQMYR